MINQNLIYFPCLAMLILSAVILIKMFIGRVTAVKSGAVDVKYFKTYNHGCPPHRMLQTDKNFSNLFEVPTLFYMICLFSLTTFKVDHFMLGLAWLYVFCRYVHSFVHVTSNKIAPRMMTYGLSWIALLLMGIKLGLDLWPSQ